MRKNKKIINIVLFFIGFLISSTLYSNCSQSGYSVNQVQTNQPQEESNRTNNSPFQQGPDPLYDYAWHLSNTGQKGFSSTAGLVGFDLNLQTTWLNHILGNDVVVLICDDGVEDTHEDLNSNFYYNGGSKNYSLSYPYTSNYSAPTASDDNHGTSVSGIIVAVGWNSKGSRGIAPNSKLISANLLSSSITQTDSLLIDHASGTFDIENMSWGLPQDSIYSENTSMVNQLKNKVLNGRNGKGSIFVKAAGNEFVTNCNGQSSNYCIGNSEFDSDNNNPYTIVVASLNALGESASYSSAGSNIWISGFGGEFGDDSPAIITTDRMGCNKGYAVTNASTTIPFENGSNGNTGCNYTAAFNGTSAATPTITGAVALILEANPSLSWRDIKYILASTATPVNYNTTSGTSHPLGLAVPSGYQWESPWIVNSAGFKFHSWYGFGRVNVDAAAQMAKTYSHSMGAYTETNWAHSSSGLNISIPDNTNVGATNIINVSTNIKIESVQIKFTVTHPDISELAVELTSPAGTKNIIINMRNSLTGIANYEGEVFLSNAFYQESSLGNWTIKLVDGKSGNTGKITSWSLNFSGTQQ